VLTELRKREHYEKPSVKRKKKSEATPADAKFTDAAKALALVGLAK